MKLDIIILSMLEKGDKTGYSLMKSIKESMGWKPSPGSIYPSLKSLLNKKYLSSTKKDNKKIYSITEQGKKLLSDFKKEKGRCLDEMGKHIKIFNHLFGSKEVKLATDMINKILKKDNMFGDITKDLIRFRIEFLKKVLYAKDRKKLKSFIKKSTKELKLIK